MGGYGSGRWVRVEQRLTLDEVHRLDVRWLQRQGFLNGWPHLVTWHCGEHPMGSCRLTRLADGVVLQYCWRVGRADWESIRQVIPLAWSACHYGGQRPWFRCLGCLRRVAVLALWEQGWLCRHCSHLPYASQGETALDRGCRKVRKIRAQMGASPNLMAPIGDKPPGMHWRTFARLCTQEQEAHRQVLHRLGAMVP